ncbi:hypothetical protein C8J57DRAFT_1512830 [Mycena rebaudengoi]|nr:hypothetical protein C8J57DRAFT_1512830 [Mycena rebaudengoi]
MLSAPLASPQTSEPADVSQTLLQCYLTADLYLDAPTARSGAGIFLWPLGVPGIDDILFMFLPLPALSTSLWPVRCGALPGAFFASKVLTTFCDDFATRLRSGAPPRTLILTNARAAHSDFYAPRDTPHLPSASHHTQSPTRLIAVLDVLPHSPVRQRARSAVAGAPTRARHAAPPPLFQCKISPSCELYHAPPPSPDRRSFVDLISRLLANAAPPPTPPDAALRTTHVPAPVRRVAPLRLCLFELRTPCEVHHVSHRLPTPAGCVAPLCLLLFEIWTPRVLHHAPHHLPAAARCFIRDLDSPRSAHHLPTLARRVAPLRLFLLELWNSDMYHTISRRRRGAQRPCALFSSRFGRPASSTTYHTISRRPARRVAPQRFFLQHLAFFQPLHLPTANVPAFGLPAKSLACTLISYAPPVTFCPRLRHHHPRRAQGRRVLSYSRYRLPANSPTLPRLYPDVQAARSAAADFLIQYLDVPPTPSHVADVPRPPAAVVSQPVGNAQRRRQLFIYLESPPTRSVAPLSLDSQAARSAAAHFFYPSPHAVLHVRMTSLDPSVASDFFYLIFRRPANSLICPRRPPTHTPPRPFFFKLSTSRPLLRLPPTSPDSYPAPAFSKSQI